jgi:hypothetical protein
MVEKGLSEFAAARYDNDAGHRRPYNRTLADWYGFERQVGKLSVLRAIPERLGAAREQHANFASAIQWAMHKTV